MAIAAVLNSSTAGKKHGEGQYRVLVGFHVDAIQFGELVLRFLFPVEQLHDAHAADVFLQERVDARDGRADAPVGVAHAIAENPGGDHDQRQHGEGGQRQAPVHLHHDRADAKQHDGVVGHGGDARGEQIVERVHVGGHARHQAAHRAAVEEAHRQALQALEDFLAQIVERLLADVLHDADLQVLHGEAQKQRGEKSERNQADAAQGVRCGKRMVRARDDVFVDAEAEQVRPDDFERTDQQRQYHREDDAPLIRPQIRHQPPQQLRVVGFS